VSTTLQVQKYAPQTIVGSIRVAGELQLGGSLIVSNSSGPLVLGDTFKLFNAGHLTGEFASAHLPPLSNGLQWDVSRLPVDGTLSVAAIPPRIAMFDASRTAMTIRFQTAAGLTYVLESTATLEHPSNWTTVATYPGTGALRTVGVQISTNTPQRFLRVRAF
jgi:hypothetical protein